MLSHPMEEVSLRVLLGLQVHHPPRALELNLIEGPLQPLGKGGNLFITPLANLKNLHEHIKQGHCAKDD